MKAINENPNFNRNPYPNVYPNKRLQKTGGQLV